MSWRSRRKFTYTLFLFLIIFIVVSFFAYPILTKKPTCFDKKQNGTETGVDCGGSCTLYCPYTVALPKANWAAVFPITHGVYNTIVYVTNPSALSGSRSADYTITLYDRDEKVITTRDGTTFIPPASSFTVFEPQIQTGERVPVKAKLVWKGESIRYEKVLTNVSTLPIRAENWTRQTALGVERLEVSVVNDSLEVVPESDYIVIIYDEKDEPIATSKTKASLDPRSTHTLFFSWPYLFTKTPKYYELVKRINPFIYESTVR